MNTQGDFCQHRSRLTPLTATPGKQTLDPIQVKWYFRVFALTTDHGADDTADDNADDVIRRSAEARPTRPATRRRRADIDHDGE